MANYLSQTTINPVRDNGDTGLLLISNEMETALKLRGATIFPCAHTTALDVLAETEKVVGIKCHIVFEEGWSNFDVDELDEPVDDKEVSRLLELSESNFVREILLLNPDVDYIQLRSSWTCSSMRLDGFDGSCLTVTRRGYMYITASDVSVSERGVVKSNCEFVPWNKKRKTAKKKKKKKNTASSKP